MTQSRSEIRAAYDTASQAYADSFLDEMQHKPADVELLKQFVSLVGDGNRVLDLGCGPGHTTAHLDSLGITPIGVDLSPQMIAKASTLFPHLEFTVGDFFQLPHNDNSVSGLLGFYCIVHLQSTELVSAFEEWFRVLKRDGILLVSFHIGSDMVLQDNFLQTGAKLEFFPFPVALVESALMEAGFVNLEIHQRAPYETEYPSNRCYIFAKKPKP